MMSKIGKNLSEPTIVEMQTKLEEYNYEDRKKKRKLQHFKHEFRKGRIYHKRENNKIIFQ